MTALELATSPPPRVEFDVDAMLMLGWVADADHNVTYVSNSLRRWIRTHHQAPEAQARLEAIDRGEQLKVHTFLAALLDSESELETPAMVEAYMARLSEMVASHETPVGRRPERCEPYDVVLQYHRPAGGMQPLAGARFVRNAATLLASKVNAERVDIVVVAITEPHDGWWRVKGFQGQLQEAWLRVRNRIVDGNRSGSIALMARNMSHNIGSHALYWVASKSNEHEQNFLSYLQVRMELLAGFATGMPLSPIAANLQTVMARFNKTRLLLNNICRSERVERVVIDYQGGSLPAVFFGGEIGIHAFYSILENCIRDSSKFAPRRAKGAETLTMHVVAEVEGEFLRIEVFDDAGNFDEHGLQMQKDLDAIRISDDAGHLEPRYWGIKERFVCAALLRGERPENFPEPGTGFAAAPWLGTFNPFGRRILSVVRRGENCAWRFYLPRPGAEILLMSDAAPESDVPEGVTVKPWSAFEQTIESVTALTVPFVVLDKLPDTVRPGELEARLPHRTYVRGEATGTRFVRIDTPNEELSPVALLRSSVKALQQKPTRLVLAIGSRDVDDIAAIGRSLDDPSLIVIDEVDLQQRPLLLPRTDREDLVIFKRHGEWEPLHQADFLRNAHSRGIVHYEHYTGRPIEAVLHEFKNDPIRTAYRLLEAALTKILIIDERIDLALSRSGDELRKQKLFLRGISVRGAEFAGYAVENATDRIHLPKLEEWGKGFHYILLHRGVSDKLTGRRPDGSRTTVEEVVTALERHGARVVMHSGRMGLGDMPPRTKFVSLANVTTWIDQDYSKLQIVEELFSLRKV